MNHNERYVSFWLHLFNQISDLYNELDFEEFLQEPWVNIMKLGDQSTLEGSLMGYLNQKIYLSSSELPQLEMYLDLRTIVIVAGEVLGSVDSENYHQTNYRIH